MIDCNKRKKICNNPLQLAYTRHQIAWNPQAEVPILAVCGEIEKDHKAVGGVELMQVTSK
jgi:hypothetical protein